MLPAISMGGRLRSSSDAQHSDRSDWQLLSSCLGMRRWGSVRRQPPQRALGPPRSGRSCFASWPCEGREWLDQDVPSQVPLWSHLLYQACTEHLRVRRVGGTWPAAAGNGMSGFEASLDPPWEGVTAGSVDKFQPVALSCPRHL